MSRYYILDGQGTPVESDLETWSSWFEFFGNRIVKQDTIQENPRIWVSTVFLGLDHNFFGDGPPILWETMIFGGEHDQYQRRYTSKEDAIKGHEEAVKLATRQNVIEAIDKDSIIF